RELEIRLSRVASVRMVAQAESSREARLWMSDGTIVDARNLTLEEDGYVRFATELRRDASPGRVAITDVAGILLDGSQMVALAALQPHAVEGPPTRYEIPQPRATDPDALLGLSPVEFRGPLTARYILP